MTPTSAPRLGDLERTVMERLWDSPDGATVREVHEALAADRQLAYTTVLTVLDRLAKKGLVTRTREGRAWRYAAKDSAESLTARAMRAHIDELHVDDRKAAILHFLDGATAEELADVRDALAELEVRAAGGSGAAGSSPAGASGAAATSAEGGGAGATGESGSEQVGSAGDAGTDAPGRSATTDADEPTRRPSRPGFRRPPHRR